jgi:hypothetical protein
MKIMVIPLQPIPNQSVSFPLNGIAYTIDINTLRGELYISVWQAGTYVLRNRALRSYAPVGFGLQLADTEGTEDPVYTGLGARWVLLGLEA